ncbi:GNAT family N-acetyltransferase [Streptomyces sp. NPDC004685]
MPTWRLRDFHDDDLDRAIQIWDQNQQADEAPAVFPVSEVVTTARAGGPAVVAVVGDELVGVAVAQSYGERGWITVVALASTWRNRGIGSSLIAELERRLRSQGVRRIGALLAQGATGTAALENAGYRPRPGVPSAWPFRLRHPRRPAGSQGSKSPRGKASPSARRTTFRPSPRPVPHSPTRH